MKKYLFTTFIFFILFIIFLFLVDIFFPFKSNNSKNQSTNKNITKTEETKNNRLKYYTYDGSNIVVTFFSTAKIVYDQKNPKSIKDFLLENESFIAGINAGYFLKDFTNAGLILVDGKKFVDIATLDPQVTHILKIENGLIDILSNEEWIDQNITEYTSFLQVGPLVIDKNVIQTELINNSLNGKRRTFRSLIGKTQSNKFFVIYSLVSFNLEEIAKMVLSLDVFKNETITVVNLDGGSSVSYFSKENPRLSYSPNRNLPSVILIK